MHIRKIAVTLALAALILASFLPLQAQTNWKVLKTFQLGGERGWDYITVDAPGHRLFVPRSTHTMVIDSETGKVLGDIPGQKLAHGVAIVPKAGRGFISDGGSDGAIVVFDLKTYAILGRWLRSPTSTESSTMALSTWFWRSPGTRVS